MEIKIFTVGGTIDKIYFDMKSTYEIGESMVGKILEEANVDIAYTIESLFRKDSLEMTEKDRAFIFKKIKESRYRRIVVTHGTDTMVKTAKKLIQLKDKVIVLTGSMAPARFQSSDATFNIGSAMAAVQILQPGVYIAMNGQVFKGDEVRKNRGKNKFEKKP
jgi:L-asparaginase